MKKIQHQFYTSVVHSKFDDRIQGAVNTPIFQSSTFLSEAAESYSDVKYTRLNNNPNQEVLNLKLASLENAEASLTVASGMAAITTALLSVLGAGDHILLQDNLYGGTHGFVVNEFPAFGIEYDFIDGDDPGRWQASLKPNTRAIYVETMSNPMLKVIDLKAVTAFAREHNLVSMIDNTFASPINFRPAEWGFDLSLHSATKYLNGHSDIIAGAIIGRKELIDMILPRLNRLGGCIDPHACFLLERGLKTLALRMVQHNRNAQVLATFLSQHPRVNSVNYPGLESHPSHLLAKTMFDGYGGMLSFEPDGSAMQLIKALKLPFFAPSLGSVESLITCPAKTSHIGLTPAERQALGITDGLIRFSVGIESADDLIADLTQALDAM